MRVPKFAQNNARKALRCLKKGSKAMTPVGIRRAKQLASGRSLSRTDLKDIHKFRRHKENASYSGEMCKDRGAVAWLGWGNSLRNNKGVPDMSDYAQRQLSRLRQ